MSHVTIRAAGLAALALAATQVSACATIVRGSEQNFTIESSPPGAQAKTSLGITCTTPCTFKAKRKTPFSVTISKDGFEDQTADVGRKLGKGGVTTGFVVNAIMVGPAGAGVDFGTGAIWDLTPNPLVIELKPLGAAQSTAEPAAESAPAEAPAASE